MSVIFKLRNERWRLIQSWKKVNLWIEWNSLLQRRIPASTEASLALSARSSIRQPIDTMDTKIYSRSCGSFTSFHRSIEYIYIYRDVSIYRRVTKHGFKTVFSIYYIWIYEAQLHGGHVGVERINGRLPEDLQFLLILNNGILRKDNDAIRSSRWLILWNFIVFCCVVINTFMNSV